MISLAPNLESLLKSLPPRPIEQKTLDDFVEKALAESNFKSSPENKRSQWEYLLRNEVFKLAVKLFLSPMPL
jgi:hypothetical protein